MIINKTESTPGVPVKFKLLFIATTTFWFTILGPLIGGIPFFIQSPSTTAISFAYMFGGIEGLFAGIVYGIGILLLMQRFQFRWPARTLLGAISGGLGCLLAITALTFLVSDEAGSSKNIGATIETSFGLSIVGIPAGAICGLAYQCTWIHRFLKRKSG